MAKGLLDEDTLAKRDQLAVDEIERDERDRLIAGMKLRKMEEDERTMLADHPEVLAQREIARRQLCQENLLPFVMRFNPDYLPGWVHKDICRRLEQFSEDVANRLSPRLLLTMPPRHGKSELTSKKFPAWHLGNHPTHEVMACSYSGSLSMSFSRMNRELLRDPAYSVLFDTKLHPESQSAEAWLTTDGGGYTSAGVGGAITGKGAHVLIIDDPVKNREDAESEAGRQGTWDWYTSTAYTRLAPGGGVLVILTRWHDDDLAGRLYAAEKEGADKWIQVDYPAEAKVDEPFRHQGEALHPARYDSKALGRIRKAVGERDWHALYQQDPAPEVGSIFSKDMVQWYDYHDPLALPPEREMVEYAAWDLAVGENAEHDYSVGGVASIDQNMDLWIRDVRRGKWGPLELCNAILDLHADWRCSRYGIERGLIEMTLGPFLKQKQTERRLWDFSYTELKPGKRDKVARAAAIQGMWENGKVHIPYNAPWTNDLIDELVRFPAGVNDDQVDMLAWLGQMLMLMAPAMIRDKRKPSWRDKLAKYAVSGGGRRTAMNS